MKNSIKHHSEYNLSEFDVVRTDTFITNLCDEYFLFVSNENNMIHYYKGVKCINWIYINKLLFLHNIKKTDSIKNNRNEYLDDIELYLKVEHLKNRYENILGDLAKFGIL